MAIRRIRIDYTLYSPDYTRDEGLCLDFKTFEAAKKWARGLGRGSNIVRNFNLTNKDGSIDWWQGERCWFFDGTRFRRVLPDPNSTKWHIDANRPFGIANQVARRRLT
jgi:hypothetical protein